VQVADIATDIQMLILIGILFLAFCGDTEKRKSCTDQKESHKP
jgi:hypothetical protein